MADPAPKGTALLRRAGTAGGDEHGRHDVKVMIARPGGAIGRRPEAFGLHLIK